MAIVEGILAAAGKNFLDVFSSSIKDEVRARFQRFDWHTAQSRYYEKIEKNYGHTRVLGKTEPVSLEGIFTDVYLLDRITALQRFDIPQLQQDCEALNKEQTRISGLELVKKGELNRLYILGKPGAGKTTFLRYIALKAANNEIKKIPIFISLKEWADSELRLMAFLVKQFDICDFPESQPLIEYILETGQATVLFDGLDETQQEGGKRDKIIEEIRTFSRKYDLLQILITCRIAASEYDFVEDKFTYLELADFSSEQVEIYVSKWFENDKTKLEQFKREFSDKENERLREMASTPLLLSLLCLSFDETGTFPQRKVEIYQKGIEALLYKWDSSRSIKRDEIYKGLSTGRKEHLFARIAAQTFDKNQQFIRKNELAKMIVDYISQLPNAIAKEDIDGNAILKAIEAQHSIFVERAENIYSFSHLTFQEYFVAKYTVDNVAKDTLKILLSIHNLADDRWREVILNTASLLDDADLFFEIYQKSLNELINKDEKIIRFLNWVNKRAAEYTSEYIPSTKVFMYSLELWLSQATILQTAVTSSGHKFIIPQNITNTVLDASSFNLSTSIFDIEEYIPLYRQANLLFLSRCLPNMISTEIKGLIFREVMNTWKLLQNESATTNNYSFVNDLTKIRAPFEGSTFDELTDFAIGIQQIIQKHFNIGHKWDFTEEQFKKLSEYFRANKLLIDCLSLAVVSNRKAIEESLFLPPK